MATKVRATIDDLYATPDDGAYELVDGRLVHMSPTGVRPGHVAGNIFFFLKLHVQQTQVGYAFGDNIGFIIREPDERTFSPDVAYTETAPLDSDDYYEGAPVFAVEVRSKGDHTARKDVEYAEKRAAYFAAGTRVVWDVNPRNRTVASYRADAPDAPTTFRVGESADAEPALPGWRVAVNDVMG